MLLAGLVCIATAYVYAELSSNWPVAGGEYVMVARTLGPLPGFVMLGVNVFNNLLFPPAIALGLAGILAVVVPGLPVIPIAVAVIAGATLLALLQIRVNAWVTGIFLVVELLAVVAVVMLGFGDAVRPVADLLATTPGVTVTRNGSIGGFTGVRIRGAEAEQTLVLIDGVRINDPSSPGASARCTVPASSIPDCPEANHPLMAITAA